MLRIMGESCSHLVFSTVTIPSPTRHLTGVRSLASPWEYNTIHVMSQLGHVNSLQEPHISRMKARVPRDNHLTCQCTFLSISKWPVSIGIRVHCRILCEHLHLKLQNKTIERDRRMKSVSDAASFQLRNSDILPVC